MTAHAYEVHVTAHPEQARIYECLTETEAEALASQTGGVVVERHYYDADPLTRLGSADPWSTVVPRQGLAHRVA